MKHTISLLALLLLPLSAPAETLDLGPHGTFSIAPPKGWTYTATKEEDSGFLIVLAPPANVNARCVLNLVFVPSGEPLSKQDIQEKVLAISDQFVEASVEKKKVLHDFAVSTGYGAYCIFTDATRVGLPPEKDSFKSVASGMVRFNDDVTVAVILLTDDAKGADFEAMLKAVSGASVGPGK
ncbi:MAG TPA: hypothetical protein VN775_09355 [Opitutaceae bacterium]|nr:hypothetical protein [Opitutaceae bacterium]